MKCIWLNIEGQEQVYILEFDKHNDQGKFGWGDNEEQVSVDLGHM